MARTAVTYDAGTWDVAGVAPATNPVAVSGGIGAVLFDSTLGSDTASIDTGAGGIAGGYHLIQISIIARTDDAAVNGVLNVTLNNDTGSNYDAQRGLFQNTTVTANTTVASTSWTLVVPGGTAPANYASSFSGRIPGYDQTTFYKTLEGIQTRLDTSAANFDCRFLGWTYRSTSAVSRLKVAASGAAKLKTGSRLTIIGW